MNSGSPLYEGDQGDPKGFGGPQNLKGLMNLRTPLYNGDRESPKDFGGTSDPQGTHEFGGTAPCKGPPLTLPLFPSHVGDAHQGVALVLLGGECWGRGLRCCRPPGVAVGHSGPLLPLSCRCCHLLPDLGPCSPTPMHSLARGLTPPFLHCIFAPFSCIIFFAPSSCAAFFARAFAPPPCTLLLHHV